MLYAIRDASQDLAFSLRLFRKRPAVLASVAAVLGVTVGAMLSLTVLADRLLLRPLSIAHPDRLVQVIRAPVAGGFAQESFPPALVDAMRRRIGELGTVLLVAYPGDGFAADPTRDSQLHPIRSLSIDVDAFAVFHVQPLLGRVFERTDAQPGAEHVAVISHEYWRTHFRSSTDVIGRTLRQRNRTIRIIGVLPDSFTELEVGTAPDLWTPLASSSAGRVLIALRASVSARQSEIALQPALEDYLQHAPAGAAGRRSTPDQARPLSVVSASTGLSTSSVRRHFGAPLLMLTLAAALLLAIGCANVGSLLLAVQVSRRREMAVRASLGATSSRLMRQVFTETLVLAAAGCAVGFAVAPWITAVLVRTASDPDRPIRISWQSDWRAAVAVGFLTTAVAILCGLLPSLMAVRGNAIRFRRALPMEDLLITCQTALSLTLLVGTGLLQMTWYNLNHSRPGFDRADVLVAELQWEQEDSRTATNAVYRNLLNQVSQLPGIAHVSISGWSYFGDNSRRAAIVPDSNRDAGQAELPQFEFVSVGPAFFETLGTPLLQGRGFTALDTEHSALVAVLSNSAARAAFGNAEVVGRHFCIFDPKHPLEIVGVVGDAKLNSLRDDAPPIVYLPFLQSEFRGTADTPASLEIRPFEGAQVSADELRRIIRETAPGLAARRIRWQNDLIERSLIRERLLSRVSAGLSLTAVLLVGFGLAGAVSRMVASRTREFGIRLALGARNRDLITGVLRRSLSPVFWGLLLGYPASIAASRLLRSVLFGVDPYHPDYAGYGALALLSLATIAAWLPALRTTRIDPAAAIRHE